MAQNTQSRMDLADIVAAAWGVCIRNAGLLMAIALAGAIVVGVMNQAVLAVAPNVPPGEGLTNEQRNDLVLSSTPFLLIVLAAQVFTNVSLVRAILSRLRGEPMSAIRAMAAGIRAWPVALLAGLITGLVCGALALTILLIPLAFYWFIAWLFAPQAVVDERAGPLAALRRSRRLVAGQWWRTFAVGLSVLVLSLLPTYVLAQVGNAVGSEVGSSIGAGLAAWLAAPFLAAGHTLLYLDIRRRKGEPLTPAPPSERVEL